MGSSIIFKDRRHVAGGRSSGNRQRFIERVKDLVAHDAHSIIGNDVGTTSSSGKVKVSRDLISEPTFIYAKNGPRTIIIPGNKEYVRGDLIDLGGDGAGGGKNGAGQGDGEDDFTINISKEEFLNVFFEDLELPNLEETDDDQMTEDSRENAGFTNSGPAARLSILQTKKKAKGRKLAIKSSLSKKHAKLEEELDILTKSLTGDLTPELEALYKARIEQLKERLTGISRKIDRVPGLEELDLRFRVTKRVPKKLSSAVMFCIMDNSGSMGQDEKRIARKYFTLLYLFILRKYEDCDVVFISHTDKAKEVTEEEFFTTRESGGTIVSTSLKLMSKIMAERYAKKTNIYVCQISDGDNISTDNQDCFQELANKIIPRCQHFSYLQVGKYGQSNNTELWQTYQMIANHVEDFAAAKIVHDDEIYEVFHEIFKKR